MIKNIKVNKYAVSDFKNKQRYFVFYAAPLSSVLYSTYIFYFLKKLITLICGLHSREILPNILYLPL